MPFRRSTRVLTSWLAALAFLMVALVPSISQALGSGNGASWIEVCTTVGAKWVQAGGDTGEPTPVPSAAHPLEHCPYCSLHADVIAIPAPPATGVPALLPAHEVPIAFLAAPRTLHAWVRAQPRAPPLFS